MKSTTNETNQTLMGQEPTNKYVFDVYRAELNKRGEYSTLEMSNVISWELFVAKMTREELKGLADFINRYLEQNNDTTSHTRT